MLLVLCFLYCFFAIVLGLYLGLELIGVRKTDRMARTLLRAARLSTGTAGPSVTPESCPPAPAEPNYFKMR